MKYIKFFNLLLILTLLSTRSFSKTTSLNWKICTSKNTCTPYQLNSDIKRSFDNSSKQIRLISHKFSKPTCSKSNNCSLFLGSIGDGFKLKLNGIPLIDRLGDYTKHESITVPLYSSLFRQQNNFFEITIQDHTHSLHGLFSKVTFLGSNRSTALKSAIDWFLRTGIQLASIYFLLIISILLTLVYLITKNQNAFSILSYSAISILYLISFSEVLRNYFNPEVLSGAIHFPLRLLQDLFLFSLLNKLLNKKPKYQFIYKLIKALYLVFITAMLFFILRGNYHYELYENIIKYAAPLVLFPLGHAFLLSFNYPQQSEKFYLIPSTFFLFVMQVNDLFVFWQYYDGYYTVKLYIPLIITLLIYLELKEMIKSHSEKEALATRVQLAMQIAHDIRSPVSVLKTLKSYLVSEDPETLSLVDESIERISQISKDFLPDCTNVDKLSLNNIVRKIVQEKRIILRDKNISLKTEFQVPCGEEDIFFKRGLLERVLSNLINNSIKAIGESGKIKITTSRNIYKQLILTVHDTGQGIPEKVINNIGKSGNTTNMKSGYGLGLSHTYNLFKKLGQEIKIKTSHRGTSITLYL